MGVVVLVERITENQLPSGYRELLLNIWIYFNVIGNTVLLPILAITFLFSKRAKRHPTLINLCITWIFSGIFSLLLFYAKQHTGPKLPDLSLCIAQASLLYGIVPMWSVAVLAFVNYMLSSVRGYSSPSSTFSMAIVLASPYVAQCSFTIAALILSIQNQEKVFRGLFFCSLFHPPLFFAASFFTLLVCIIIMGLEVALVVVIYRNWRTRRSAGLPSLSTSLVARVLIFGVYIGLGVVVTILSMLKMSFAAAIFAATAGTVVFLIFGTQVDVFRTWCFWKKYDDQPPTSPQLPSKTLIDGSSYPASLEAIFRSPQSERKFPWSDRPYRPLSIPSIKRSSARRSSTKHFMRLPDDAPNELFSGQGSTTRQVAERQRVGIQDEYETTAQRLPRRSKLGEQHLDQVRIAVSDGNRKPENARKRRKWDLPRPKGPRKNMSAINIISTADLSVTRPATAVLRPLPDVSTSADYSWMLGARTMNTTFSS